MNVSSVNGLGAAPGAAFYSMAKGGILALTKAAAMEYAAEGIRVNALAAGAFDTPMLNRAFEQAAGGDAERRKEMEQQFLSLVPLHRIGRPEEAAEAVAWLCSEASSYVTGHSMIADGGWTAWARSPDVLVTTLPTAIQGNPAAPFTNSDRP